MHHSGLRELNTAVQYLRQFAGCPYDTHISFVCGFLSSQEVLKIADLGVAGLLHMGSSKLQVQWAGCDCKLPASSLGGLHR